MKNNTEKARFKLYGDAYLQQAKSAEEVRMETSPPVSKGTQSGASTMAMHTRMAQNGPNGLTPKGQARLRNPQRQS